MSETTAVDRSGWAQRLDQLTSEHEGESVTIELLDQTYGDQYEAERLPFAYASYDPRDDVVVVAVGGQSGRYPVVLRHMMWHPSEIDVTTDGTATSAYLRVIDGEGTATLVSFFRREGST